MRKLKTAFCGILVALGALVVTPPTTAHETLHLTIESMAEAASFIVEGTVQKVQSDWNSDGTQIYTYVDIAVEQAWKGELPAVLQLRLLGGQIGDLAFSFEDGPMFTPDERVVVFLEGNPQSRLPIVGVGEGLFHVAVDPATGAISAMNSHGISVEKAEFDRRLRAAIR